MQDGDLGTWDKPRIMLVLEDTCCHITGHPVRPTTFSRKVWAPDDPEDWEWGLTTIKTIQRYAYNNVPVEVITFVSQEVADLAAAWFAKYDIEVASVQYYDRAHFSRSLTWRHGSVQRIIDTDPERLLHYGQRGHQTLWNSEF